MSMMQNIIAFQPRPVPQPLRRPRLLAQAARAGLASYRRERDLPRLLKCEAAPSLGAALPRLRAEEETLDFARRESDAAYDLQRHIFVLIAILAETRAVNQTIQPVNGATLV